MKSKGLISVIVPVYNVEKFIFKCLDSILNQTYKNFEIIVVNDGSTDKSLDICREFVNKDKRVALLTKKNGGLSDARNFGLNHSKGEWVTFIDSDDFVSPMYLEHLIGGVTDNNTKIVVSRLKNTTDFEAEPVYDKKISYKNLSTEKALKTVFLQKKFDTNATAKLYLRELFEDISFPVGILFEDFATTYKIFFKSKKISFADTQDYFYYQRSGSILNSKFNERKLILEQLSNELIASVDKRYPDLYSDVRIRVLSAYFNTWRQITVEEKEFDNKFWNLICEYRKYGLYFQSRFKVKLGSIITYLNQSMANKIMKN